MLVTTYRRSGAPVSTPVWLVPVSDGRVGMWTGYQTGKAKRLRHDHKVRVQTCTARGRVAPGAPVYTGTAELVRSGPLYDEVQAKLKKKYRRMVPVVKLISRLTGQRRAGQDFSDTVVLLTLTGR